MIETKVDFVETVNTANMTDGTHKGFVYSKKFYGICNEMEFTMPIIYGIGFVILLVAIAASVTIFLTFKYKNEYYQLVGSGDNETELKDIGTLFVIPNSIETDTKLEVR